MRAAWLATSPRHAVGSIQPLAAVRATAVAYAQHRHAMRVWTAMRRPTGLHTSALAVEQHSPG